MRVNKVTIEENKETGRLEAILRIGANWEDVNVIHGDDASELEALSSLRNSIWAFRDGLRAAANLHGGLEDPCNREAMELFLRCFTVARDLGERMRELRQESPQLEPGPCCPCCDHPPPSVTAVLRH